MAQLDDRQLASLPRDLRAPTRGSPEAAAEVKGPDGLAFLAAVKAADRAIRLAGEQKNEPMLRALEASRAPLGEQLVEMGLRLPVAKGRGGRGRKAS